MLQSRRRMNARHGPHGGEAPGYRDFDLDVALIRTYERCRDKFLRDNPSYADLADPPSPALITAAPTLWIEGGAMSGGSRNQVEFNRDLAAFFGPPSTRQRVLQISVGQNIWSDRPLTPKTTSFNVEIWRLSLPTPLASGLTYAGQVLRLTRLGGDQYRLEVAAPGSSLARQWRWNSVQNGYVGKTSGNREFGLT